MFKRNKNIIKKLLRTTLLQPLLHPGLKQHETNLEKIMLVTNVNKKFTTFPTMIKDEKHIIDDRAKIISEDSNEYLPSLIRSLKIKFLHLMRRSMRMLSFKMRNLRGLQNDIFDQQSWGFFKPSAFRSSCPEVFYKKVVLNNFKIFTEKNLRRSLSSRWHSDVVTTTTLSQSCGKVKNESCGDVSFRRCDNVVVRSYQDVATTLLQCRYNIKQWLCRCFLITDICQFFPAIET